MNSNFDYERKEIIFISIGNHYNNIVRTLDWTRRTSIK